MDRSGIMKFEQLCETWKYRVLLFTTHINVSACVLSVQDSCRNFQSNIKKYVSCIESIVFHYFFCFLLLWFKSWNRIVSEYFFNKTL